MSSLLQQLNNESILLMYLAGELPAEDRVEVEHMLAGDARLRDELDAALREAYDATGVALASADKSQRLMLPAASAVRRVGNAVRSWHMRRLASPPAKVDGRRLRFPWWAYPLTATAALLVAGVSWWVQQDRGPIVLKPWPIPTTYTAPDEPTPEIAPSDLPVAEADVPLETYPVLVDARDSVLDEAEDELLALSEPSDDSAGMLLFGETDER